MEPQTESNLTTTAIVERKPDPIPEVQVEVVQAAQLTPNEYIEQLKDGRIDASSLTPENRLWYVEHLTQENMTVTQMARLLKVSDRTIERDRRELRSGTAMEPTLSLADELLGEMQRLTFDATQKLIQMSRDDRAPFSTRVWAQTEAVKAQERFLNTAVKLGYLEGGKRRINKLNEERSAREREAMYAKS